MLQTKHLENRQALDQVDVGYYAPILRRVLEARRQFHAWVDTIPEPVGHTVLEMSQGNQQFPVPDKLVGERDAFWFGELVGASEEAQLVAAVGSIAGYAYFLHQDHVIDADGGEIRRSELASNFLYAKLLESFQAITPSGSSFWRYWTRYLKEYAEGGLSEAVKGRLPRRYSRDDLRLIAARSAPVKICIASLALGSGKDQEIPRYEAAVEDLSIGLQFRDDLTDCVEDMLHGNYTPVVSHLVGDQQPTMDVLKRAALYTDVIETLLDESTLYLLRASRSFGLTKEMSLQAYIEYLSSQNRTMKGRVSQIREAVASGGGFQKSKVPLSIYEEPFWSQIEEALRVRLEY